MHFANLLCHRYGEHEIHEMNLCRHRRDCNARCRPIMIAGARAIFRHTTLRCAGILAGTLMNPVPKQDLASPPAMQGPRILNSCCIEFCLVVKGYVPVPRWQP